MTDREQNKENWAVRKMKFSYYYIFEGEESRRYKFKNKNMLLNTGFLKSPVLSLTKPEMVKAFDLIQFKYFISLKRIVISYQIAHKHIFRQNFFFL